MDLSGPREVARAHSAYGDLVLRERGAGVLELRANGIFVMDTAETSTERELARAALARLGAAEPLSVLVGGLGLGFTLAEVLADRRVARCVVAEIDPVLVGWVRDGTVPHGPALLGDARVEVVVGDVAATLRAAAEASYDLVLLDVDNGPDQLVHESNDVLYTEAGLSSAARTLRPGGRIVVWSASPAPGLLVAMRASLAEVDEDELPVTLQGRDVSYWLYSGAVTSAS